MTQELEMLDDRSYHFRLRVYNEDGKHMTIRKGAIEELVIEDNILDFHHHGYLIFQNPHDMIERATVKHVRDEEIPLETFRFRGDARDYLDFAMHPNLDSDLANSSVFKSDFYSLDFNFVIYKIEDLPADNASEKKKKIYFHDRRYQRLLERDIYWHSGQAAIRQKETVHSKPLSQMSDYDRSIRTGSGIKDIIETVLPGSRFSPDWDNGARRVFYTTPANSKAIDDLQSIFNKHVSSDDTNNQPSILKFERYSKTWSLNPISYYFNRAYNKSTQDPGAYQNERFVISAQTDAAGSTGSPTKSPTTSRPSPVNNVYLPGLGEITGYVYTEMPGADNQKFIVSTPIHTYHTKEREFMFYHQKTSIESMYNFFKETVTDKCMGDTTGPFTEFFINNTKKSNKNVNLVHSTHDDTLGVLIDSRNSVLRTALYSGGSIMFESKGSTNRRTGRFISIDRNDPYNNNDFDSKLLGQYFVTKITHRLTPDGYFNSIIGVKPYYYSAVDFNNDIQ